jgi:hypothetical protein
MKAIRKYIKGFFLKGALVLGLVSCSSDFLDINVDPNNPSTASLDFLLTTAQLSGGFSANRIVMEHSAIFVQQFYNLAPSTFNLTGSSYGNDFSAIYAVSLKDLQTVQTQAGELGLNGYVGISKVMKAYLFMTLVDYFGDIPYSEALQGETLTKTPKYDDDAFVYDQLILLLGEAKADLNAAITANELKLNADLVYGSASTAAIQYGRWIKAANTLLLRLNLNIGKVDAARATSAINALITENNMISSNAEDFQLVYGNTQAPQNRHPIFQQDYAGAGKTFYMTNYFMYHMIQKADPRLPFYIFRQGTDANVNADAQVRPCRFRTDCVYGWLSVDPQTKGLAALPAGAANGYIGRDGGDPSGIPGDQAVRATFGVYPIGGSYDRGPGGGSRTLASGATGAGVFPMMTNFMRAFMLSEAALTLGTTGDPKALMMEGIDASLAKVEAFGRANDPVAPAMTDAAKNGYKATVGDAYDAAANVDARLGVVMSEKYYANFGNGLEVFTDYRRTGKPDNLPAALAPTGPQPRRLLLPPGELTSNPNAPNPPPLVTDRVFWDVN